MAPDASKADLRQRMAVARSGLSEALRRKAGESIARDLARARELAGVDRVALFAGLPDEPDTRPLFERLHEAGVVLHLPRSSAVGLLDFVSVSSWEDLQPGRYGVLEPGPEREPIAISELQLALIPGVAFDRAGGRLGRGGGYYDRTFPAGAGGPILIGVAFAFQLVERVPVGPLDRCVDALATEEGIVRMSRADRGASA